MASGITTAAIMVKVMEARRKGYTATLANFGMKKKQLEDMEAAFRDGMGTMLRTLLEMKVIEYVSEDDQTPAQPAKPE